MVHTNEAVISARPRAHARATGRNADRARFIAAAAVVPRFRGMNKNGRVLKNQSSAVNFNFRPRYDLGKLAYETFLDVAVLMLKFIKIYLIKVNRD